MRLPLNTSSKSSDSDAESVQELTYGLECTSSTPTMRARLTYTFSESELDDSEVVASSFSQAAAMAYCQPLGDL
ncbi:hypothetical protein Taro_027382 [Colocasia esculenta]|uniref:Uncharacterized protein n=1 Tax=Colocasia esculenta TaxID=4460 RepID=A0A843VFK5_COLES|nr:hypothetical protein [Colocasia esculenta]